MGMALSMVLILKAVAHTHTHGINSLEYGINTQSIMLKAIATTILFNLSLGLLPHSNSTVLNFTSTNL
jgi:hypothetical protein